MNIVVIEDEVLTADDLIDIIGNMGNDIRISGMLDSVQAGLDFFRTQPAVDLIFSDIQLGDGVSFEIFRTVTVTAPVIFCTAYDEYALEAIRTNGIDYILKPFTAEAIARAVGKYEQFKQHFSPIPIDYEKLILAMGHSALPRPVNSILVYHRDKVLPIGLEEVALFYISGDLTYLYCLNGKEYVVTQTLDELDQMAAGTFFRVNRQYLVSRRAIKDAHHYQHRKFVLNLTIPFKETLVVSKNRTSGFLSWLTR